MLSAVNLHQKGHRSVTSITPKSSLFNKPSNSGWVLCSCVFKLTCHLGLRQCVILYSITFSNWQKVISDIWNQISCPARRCLNQPDGAFVVNIMVIVFWLSLGQTKGSRQEVQYTIKLSWLLSWSCPIRISEGLRNKLSAVMQFQFDVVSNRQVEVSYWVVVV